MRCHKCNQDSIKIIMGKKDIDNIHITCDICGLDIDCGSDNPMLCELFIYNENLESSELLGQEAFDEDKKIEDNPYFLSSDQIILNKKWELGYNREKEKFEKEALHFSSENLKNETVKIEKEKTILTEEHIDITKKYDSIVKEIKEIVKNKPLLGLTYKKRLLQMLSEIPDN